MMINISMIKSTVNLYSLEISLHWLLFYLKAKAEKNADEQSKRMRNENFYHFVLSKERMIISLSLVILSDLSFHSGYQQWQPSKSLTL